MFNVNDDYVTSADAMFYFITCNASVKSGFSINKQLLVENVLDESLVPQRISCDAGTHLGGLRNVLKNTQMITSVRSRGNYQLHLNKKKNVIKRIRRE